MRLSVVQFAAAYLTGMWVGSAGSWPTAIVALVVAAIGGLLLTRRWSALLLAGAVGGLFAGQLTSRVQDTSCRSLWEPGKRAAVVRVLDGTGESLRTRAAVRHSKDACHGTLIVRFDRPVGSGAVLIAVGSYRGRGVFRVEHARQIETERGWRLALREAVAGRIRTLYGPRAGIIEALVLGRRDDLPRDVRESFIGAGIAHLLAISGLHVGLFVAWIVLALRLTPLRRYAPGIAAAVAWGYVIILGFPAAATRAAAFISIYVYARYRQRHPPTSAVLAVGALVVASIDQTAIRSVGAWLSVSAVWATAYGPRQLPDRWRSLPMARLAAASTAATFVTAPITAFAFGSVAPIGAVTNLAAVPLAGVAVPAVLSSLVLGSSMAAGAGLVLAAVEWLAATAASLPGGHLIGVPGWKFALPWFAALVVVVWLLERCPRWGVLRVRLAFAGAVVAWVAVALHAARDQATGVTVHVLDVGQGDAIVVRTPRGRWLAIDAGPISRLGNAGHRTVVPFLRRRGVKRLHALIISHGDADHLGGASAITASLEPRLVLEPGQPLSTGLYMEHLASVDATGAAWRAARAGDTLVVDGVRLIVLHPTAEWIEHEFRPNENSIVARLEYGCLSVLLTGDAGLPVERLLARGIGPVDVLKVGHHGSAGSTSDELLEAVKPRIAVISVGPNSYGHPAPEVLDRLASRDIESFRTDRDGTVTLRSDGRYLEVVTRDWENLVGRLTCRIRRWLQSNNSFSNRNACTQVRRVSSPICSTTSP